jgi:hypothetical protein
MYTNKCAAAAHLLDNILVKKENMKHPAISLFYFLATAQQKSIW